jgi:glycerol-3-phosphate dehydrogenase
VHIVVPRDRLPLDDAIVMQAIQDNRIVFAVPFFNTTYIGTTDTDFDGDFDSVRATSDDVEYLLMTTNHHFPTAELTAEDVWSTWAGVRPLIRSDETSASKTSREHQLYSDPRGITTVAGGKLTTYRSMAEEIVDSALEHLHRTHEVKGTRCITNRVPLDANLPIDVDPVDGPSDPIALHLWRHFGSGADWIRSRWDTVPDEKEPLTPSLPYTLAEVSYAVIHEQAERLEDVFVRRLQLFFRDPDQGLTCADRVAQHMARLLGQSDEWVAAELEAYGAGVERSRLGARALSTHQRSTRRGEATSNGGQQGRVAAS